MKELLMTHTNTLTALQKETKLLDLFRKYGKVVIAYSGGVDSTYLAAIAFEALGPNAHLLIGDSPSIPRQELDEAISLAEEQGWHLDIIKTKEFKEHNFLRNDTQRCYYCKRELFGNMQQYAAKNHITTIIHGETDDDSHDDTRVGARAAREKGIVAPLALLGFSKDEIRERSKARDLPTWEKPSFACLASRIPTNQEISIETLAKIEAAEALLKASGFRQYRARHHDTICRIEVEAEDFIRIIQPKVRQKLVNDIKALGYRYVTLDLAGYRTGSTAG